MTQSDAGRTPETSTLTALYDRRGDATKAQNDLRALGLSDSSVKLHANEGAGGGSSEEHHHGFLHALEEFFFPDDDRHAYAEGLTRGGFLVTVKNVPSSLQSQAVDILDDAGSVDVGQRTEEWRADGWSAGTHGQTERLGASDHVGQPRAYAESALDALSTDPLPSRRAESVGRGRARAYISADY